MRVAHRADGDALAVEHRPLLGVQFDKSMGTVQRQCRLTQVADACQFIAQPLAVGAHGSIGGIERQAACVHQRTEHVRLKAGTLLVGEHGHHQRAPRGDTGLVERSHHLQRAEHAEVAIKAPASAYRVDV